MRASCPGIEEALKYQMQGRPHWHTCIRSERAEHAASRLRQSRPPISVRTSLTIAVKCSSTACIICEGLFRSCWLPRWLSQTLLNPYPKLQHIVTVHARTQLVAPLWGCQQACARCGSLHPAHAGWGRAGICRAWAPAALCRAAAACPPALRWPQTCQGRELK